MKDKVLASQVLLKIPSYDREKIISYQPFSDYFSEELKVFDQEEDIKSRFNGLTNTFLKGSDSSEIIEFLKDMPYHEISRPWFLRNSILIAWGKGNDERERISQLHKELAKELELKFVTFSFAYDLLIEGWSDYILDIPHFPDYISMFIARAIYDGYFNAMYILHAETFDSTDMNQLKILKNACSYLSLHPVDRHLDNIWGCPISNNELCQYFETIIQDFDSNSNNEDTLEKLKELDCIFYYHEFVKRLILFYVNVENQEDINYNKIQKLLSYLLTNLLLTKSQLEVGIKNARHDVNILFSKESGT